MIEKGHFSELQISGTIQSVPPISTEKREGKQEPEQNGSLTKLSEQSQHHRTSKMPEL